MKTNNLKKYSNKYNKSSILKLSPTHQNKNKKDINFNLTSLKNYEFINKFSSPMKSTEEYLLNKKNNIVNTAHHRKTKSSSQSYTKYHNILNDSNNNLNDSASKLSYLLRRTDYKKNNANINYNYNNNIRNKLGLYKKELFESKKSSNLLSISFSSNIIKEMKKEKEKYYNKSNYKNKKSLFILDNLYNIEETRNTTSITGFNNSNLLNKKQILIKDNNNSRSTKMIKINRKSRKQLFHPKNNSSILINFTNNKNNNLKKNNFSKIKEKDNSYHYIYSQNNINTKSTKEIKSNNNPKNLIISKRTYKNSIQKSQSTRKISFVNAISENLKLHYKNKTNKFEIKNDFNYEIESLKNSKKNEVYVKIKRRKNKSQEKINTIGIEYNNQIENFKSIEEIHFTFVQMNQKKKAFLENE